MTTTQRLRLALATMLTLALATCPLLAQAQSDEVPPDCAAMVKAIGIPDAHAGSELEILCRTGHLLAHSDTRKTPLWVVERLTPERFKGTADRSKLCSFVPDPKVKNGAKDADYQAKSKREKRSFDRGHMAPAADMKWTDKAMKESCYFSNIAPQQGLNLNRHIWADLEGLVRDWTCDRGEVYVVTGPIFDVEPIDTLGADEVAVPSAFYKLVYEPRQMRAIAFILPDKAVPRAGRTAADVLTGFIVKPSEVERRSGVKMFTAMSARDRNRLRANAAPMWGVKGGCKTKAVDAGGG